MDSLGISWLRMEFILASIHDNSTFLAHKAQVEVTTSVTWHLNWAEAESFIF